MRVHFEILYRSLVAQKLYYEKYPDKNSFQLFQHLECIFLVVSHISFVEVKVGTFRKIYMKNDIFIFPDSN